MVVKSKDSLLNIHVNVFVNDICLPVEKQNIEFAKRKYLHLQQLELADTNQGSLPLEIDILIGTQDYWNFIGVHQVSGASGPVAISSKLGYHLTGHLANECDIITNTNVATTHSLKQQSEILLTKLLKEGVWVIRPPARISGPHKIWTSSTSSYPKSSHYDHVHSTFNG